ncbi:MAG TPA: protein kinase [Thermodesulfobacteriota bacterium]|nr:protein kinase [Thermodesulfobacteriota bacterium]
MEPKEAATLQLGKYLLFRKIAQGIISELYLAKMAGPQQSDQLFAVRKILQRLSGERDVIKTFLEEAKSASFLKHENIARVYDFGQEKNSVFMGMEYVAGKDLGEFLSRSREKNLPLALEDALYIAGQICSALEYAHTLTDANGTPLNIVHRDVSPKNILITTQGAVKILDFGLVRAADRSPVTRHEMMKAKVAYMSPEQALREKIDRRTDMFSMGILLYEMVTGKRMYSGETMQVMARVRKAEFEPAQNAVSGLPDSVYALIEKTLRKEKEQRFASCGEMAAVIEACLSELPSWPGPYTLREYMVGLFGEETGCAIEPEPLRLTAPAKKAPEKPPTKEALPEAERESPLIEALRKTAEPQENPKPNPIAETRPCSPPPEPPAPEPQTPQDFDAPSTAAPALALEPTETPELDGDMHTVQEILTSARSAAGANPRKGRRSKIHYVAGTVILLAAIAGGWAFWPKPESNATGNGSTKSDTPAETERAAQAVRNADKENAQAAEARALREKARGMIENDPKQANALLLKSLQLEPDSLQGHFHLGLTYAALQKRDKAIEAYKKAISIDPRFADAYFNLGYIYATGRDYASAERMYSEVVKLAPPYLDEALFNLALVQEKTGNRGEGIENLNRAVRINPKNEAALKLLNRMRGES